VTRRFRRLIAGGVVAAALQIACARMSPPPLTAPPDEVPRTALDAICTKVRGEGITGEIDFVRTTEPLITRDAMIALAESGFYAGKTDPAQVADSLAARTLKLPVTLGSGGCDFRPVDAATQARHDTMLLQVSAPIINPFVRGAAGLFARLSLGNEAAQWYWVPIGMRNGVWATGTPTPISLRQ